jgi:hypothetical protein
VSAPGPAAAQRGAGTRASTAVRAARLAQPRRRRGRTRLAAALALAAATAAGGGAACHKERFAVDLTVDRGVLPVPARVVLTIDLLDWPSGNVLTTRTEDVTDGAAFFADEGSSNRVLIVPTPDADAVRVMGEAFDAAGASLGTGSVEVERADGVVPSTLTLAAPGSDAGSDAGPSDSGSPSDGGSTCGDGDREGAEDCDGADFGGVTCATVGAPFTGGTLACDGLCAFDLSGCTCGPSVPLPRRPMNGSYVGALFVAGTMRPTFAWEAGAAAPPACELLDHYELTYGTDPALAAGVTPAALGSATTYQPPADLAVSLVPPVGTRYFWHVRACGATACSPYAPTWYFDAGRSDRDFDADGYADLVVGANGVDGTGAQAGAVYIYRGGAGALDTTADVTLPGQAPGEELGVAVAPAGDVNGDAVADLVVGAWHNGLSGAGVGRAYVYFGGVAGALDGSPDVILDPGVTTEANFGRWVAGAGDLNGDGFADVAVGAPLDDTAAMNAGAVYVYFGGASFDASVDGVLVGEAADDHFGPVGGAGDVNGDGFADLVVGAADYGMAPFLVPDPGRAYVYFGGAGPAFNETADVVLTEMDIQAFGAAVAGGDVNGDGFSDVFVGESLANPGNSGRVFAYFGGAAFDAVAETVVPGAGNELFGSSVAFAGDVDGDGFGDVLVGGPFSNVAGTWAGQAYLLRGGSGATLSSTLDATFADGVTWDEFGSAAGSAGDVDGDGYADVVVGASLADDAIGNEQGKAFLYRGGPVPVDASADAIVIGAAANDYLGVSVSR